MITRPTMSHVIASAWFFNFKGQHQHSDFLFLTMSGVCSDTGTFNLSVSEICSNDAGTL